MSREIPDRNVRLPDELHDSERMAGLLEQAGYEATDDDRDADVIVINTCSVRERAEEKLFTRLGEIRADGRGQRDSGRSSRSPAASRSRKASKILQRSNAVDVIIGTQNLKRLPMLVDRGGRAARPPRRQRPPSRSIPSTTSRFRWGSRGATIRSRPTSRSSKAATSSAPSASSRTRAATSGCGPWPTSSRTPGTRWTPARGKSSCSGQIVNHYQAPDDPACDFAALLERLNDIAGLERIRFASPHPRHVTPRMIAAMRDLPKVCRHLHLPVQSGSTRVLAAMRRRHTREQYLELVGRLREAMPDIALSTDMIVGFPGETEEDFEETLSLTAAVRYHSMFSFKYSPRPNTLALKRMPDDVPEEEKTRRIVALQSLQREIQGELFAAAVGRTL